MIHRVEVWPRPGQGGGRGAALRDEIAALGVPGVEACEVADLYYLDGDVDPERVAALLLTDPVTETTACRPAHDPLPLPGRSVEVMPLPGVTDSTAESLLLGARLAGVDGLRRAASGRRYLLRGAIDPGDAARLARGLLANEVVQTWALDRPVDPPFRDPPRAADAIETVALTDLDERGLLALSAARRLSLDAAEMAAIAAHFRVLGREPTDLELEALAQTWSEHCIHKTFRALVEHEEPGRPVEVIDGLLSTFIRGATEAAARPWVRSAFVDNAGIVAFDDDLDLAFKVETHNHPSALEPFGGANTGVGGVVRDVLGVSARPIANTDVLCFGPPDLPFADLPAGVLHPRRIAQGVVAGIEDYGNKMGIPTLGGAFVFDPGYTANPLVFCGCLGVLPTGSHPTAACPGDLVVVLGGRTGRDGLRGATFSSMEMDHTTGEIAGSAVQIGHPIHEKQVMEVVLRARDARLYTAVTDCGAGGLSSAVGEMAERLGATVELERVPTKYPGLRPWEIWLSEAQERMVMAVPPAHWEALVALCAEHDVEATVLGTFTGDGRLRVLSRGRLAGDLDTRFLHKGIPRRRLRSTWSPPALTDPHPPRDRDLGADLQALLASPDIRSKEAVVRIYDHEVQGGTVGRPLVGRDGPGDGAVLVPLDAWRSGRERRGVALGAGIQPAIGALDPYAMAWAAVDEAVRNCVALGADPDRIALLDNFCWGNPSRPETLGGLVRCARGCRDAAVAYGMPFISGKDSLNNEYTGRDGQRTAIPGTLLISALGIVPDVARRAESALRAAGDTVYVLGPTAAETGASAWYRLLGLAGGRAPAPRPEAIARYRALFRAMEWVTACHDPSEGGLAVALAEMAIGGGLGVEVDLARIPADGPLGEPERWFAESLGRHLVTVDPAHVADFEGAMAGHAFALVGTVRAEPVVRIGGTGIPLGDLDRAFRG